MVSRGLLEEAMAKGFSCRARAGIASMEYRRETTSNDKVVNTTADVYMILNLGGPKTKSGTDRVVDSVL
jgi:hypothetical protein